MNIDRIHAVATDLNIEAALARPEIRAIARLLASAGVARPTAKIPLGELDAKFDASTLTSEQRIRCKLALERAGLLA